MATDVTNQQIFDMLHVLGYGADLFGSSGFDLSGAQNSAFKDRLKSIGITDDDFDKAKNMARIGNPTDVNGVSDFLKAMGFNDAQVDDTFKQAGVDIRAPRDWSAKLPQVYDVIGKTYGDPLRQFLSSDRPPGQALAPAAPQFTPGSDAYRGTIAPAVKANTPAPVSSAPAAGPAIGGTAGMGGGGPNNQPPSPATWNDDQIRTFIKQNFGSSAYFVDIPEVWDALKGVVKSGKGVNGLEPALEGTAFWKQNTANARSWYVRERADPAQTAADIAQQTQAITNQAQQAGISLDPDRAQQMAQSYLRYGWTQTDLQHAIGAEWHYDPSTKNQAAAVTQMKADAQNWLVPLSDQAIQTWGQGLISGTVTQDQYAQYLRDNAKSLMPQLSTLIDQHAGDPKFSVSTFADPYKQHAANLLGLQPDQIDFNDSKWRKALDTVDPKTGERRIMSLGEWESTIKTDPTYGYDKTANGIQDGLALAGALKTSMGF